MGDLISVIVPVYNVEDYLDECVESLIKQTYENLEIILVDDGSKDSCPEMCDNWAKKDSRIRVVHKENGGLSSARNAGLDVCTGEYISFIDSDDFINETMYETMLSDMKNKEVDIVRCAMPFYKENEVVDNYKINTEKSYTGDEMLDCFFYYKEDMCSGVCDKLFKAELFNQVRFPEGINSEDYYVLAMIYAKSKGMYYNHRPFYYYRVRQGSISRKQQIHSHSYDKIIISDKVKEYVINNVSERIDDGTAFQFMTRFGTYYVLLHKKHEKNEEKAWKKDLKIYLKDVLNNKKVSKGFKLKYLVITFCPHLYVGIKNLLKYENPLDR